MRDNEYPKQNLLVERSLVDGVCTTLLQGAGLLWI